MTLPRVLLSLLLAHGAVCGTRGIPSPYEPDTAIKFARFSHAAYCDSALLGNWTCIPCLTVDPAFKPTVIQNTSTGVQAFVGSSAADIRFGDLIVIGFRGTVNWDNWIHNLEVPKTRKYSKCANCAVHEGFLNSWISVAKPIMAELSRLLMLRPAAKVFITGHSLGAAMALLCAAELGPASPTHRGRLRDHVEVEGLYTYGLPRVGNDAFAKWFGAAGHVVSAWRLTHAKDPVPHLPPLHFLGYHHTNTEVFYNENSSAYRVCDGSGEDDLCSDNEPLIDTTNIADHLTYLNVSIAFPC